jgi:hypothetical protein
MNATNSVAQIPSSLPESIDKIIFDEVLKIVNHVEWIYIEARAAGNFLGAWRFRRDWPQFWMNIMNDIRDRGVSMVDEIQINVERLFDKDILSNLGGFYDAVHEVFPGADKHPCAVLNYTSPQRKPSLEVINGGKINSVSLEVSAA